MQRINTPEWGIDQFDQYARLQTEKVEREINQLDDDIRKTSELVFRNPEMGGSLLRQTRAELDETLDRLEFDPTKLGRLRGGPFNPDDRKQALAQASHLRALLKSRDDKQVVLGRYEQLYLKSVRARELPAHEQAAARESLQNEKEYCDVTYEVRSREHHGRMAPLQLERESNDSTDRSQRHSPEEKSDPEWYRSGRKEVHQQDQSPSRHDMLEQQPQPTGERKHQIDSSDAWWRVEASTRSIPYVGLPEVDARTGRNTAEWEERRLEIEERERRR
ncbi:hypothetical protein [Bradyrhizobium sp. LB11.1]|uniref:hypothetical protein n=1 Tax=Bradyrhizobium sp. LB11.1 TaxID=3156326 RepID=UPI0033920E71